MDGYYSDHFNDISIGGYEMMYSIDGYIVCNNQGVLNAVQAILPNELDPRIDGEFIYSEFTDEDGNNVLNFIIRFKPVNKADRDSLFASLNGIDGLFHKCEAGSFYGYHTCGNYEDPPVSCRALELYRKKYDGVDFTIEHTINGVPQ